MLKGKNDFKKVTSLRLIYYMMRRVIWLQAPTVFWLGW
jgi:hypothetical protein